MRKLSIILVLTILFIGCKKEEIDNTPPEIDPNFNSFPIQCSEIKRGETFTFKARFTDDIELGSFGIDIHHNFDHHNHSTEAGECDLGTIKTPANPFVLLKNYEIPTGLKLYEASVLIDVPDDIDTGDYHFMIKVTDKAGWQTLKGVSVKIIP
ncbi:DUF4625 domain-containing protein [Globicatella sulfidifaciens]|uniref:DUF4625 domain-containing protein n=1 Tax=Globicatella sulfidifaciens TaxID=136093 RepID=A0A7X8GZ83_9LACT|nr:DUF4625 domain-containing protein [Globicatella sulfidifaciens]NLJ17544.1 DUF4625 domain-containing protein [Globicatella sulfidifaciens]